MTKPPPAILGAIVPVLMYFTVTRLLGHTQLTGVVMGIVAGLVLVSWRMLATRQVGQIELFTTAILAVSLIPSLVTGEPRIALAAQSIDGFFAAGYFFVSSYSRNPLVANILGPLYVRFYRVQQASWDWCVRNSTKFRSRIRLMSVVCSLTAVTGSCVGLYLALNFPIDTVVLVGPFIGVILVPAALIILKSVDRPLLTEVRNHAAA